MWFFIVLRMARFGCLKKGSNQEDIACSTIIPYVYRYTTLNDNIKTTTAEIAMKMCLYVLITTLGVMNDAKYKKGLENECSIFSPNGRCAFYHQKLTKFLIIFS